MVENTLGVLHNNLEHIRKHPRGTIHFWSYDVSSCDVTSGHVTVGHVTSGSHATSGHVQWYRAASGDVTSGLACAMPQSPFDPSEM